MSNGRSKTSRPASRQPGGASGITQKLEPPRDARPQASHTPSDGDAADDATMQLSADLLRLQRAADRAATVRPADNARARRLHTSGHDVLSEATIDFEIPAEWIEPIPPGAPPGNNRVSVFDPYAPQNLAAHEASAPQNLAAHEASAPQNLAAHEASAPQPAPRGKMSAPRTIKMPPVRAQALARAALDVGSETLGAGFSPTELRDLDAEGFHVVVARVDAHRRVQLPADMFAPAGPQPGTLVLLKVRVMQDQQF